MFDDNKTKKRILILAPHADDGEFGAGGSISKLQSHGHIINYVSFASVAKYAPPELPKDFYITELKEATKYLNIPPDNLIIYDFEVRKLNYVRQEILEEMIKIRDDFHPDLVFLPSPNDTHQDHGTISSEGIRAFKYTSLLGYELPWNTIQFNTQAFIKLTSRHLDDKIGAISAYKSQTNRPYFDVDFIKGLAKTRGVQIGAEYAEAFEVIRWVL